MEREEADRTIFVGFHVEESLHRKLKSRAALKGQSVKKWIGDAIRSQLKAQKSERGKAA